MRGTQPNRNVRFSAAIGGETGRSVDIAKTTQMTQPGLRLSRASYSILHHPPLPTKVKLADKVASLLLKEADVRRRDFICVLGGAAVAPAMLRPFAARAQQPGIPDSAPGRLAMTRNF